DDPAPPTPRGRAGDARGRSESARSERAPAGARRSGRHRRLGRGCRLRHGDRETDARAAERRARGQPAGSRPPAGRLEGTGTPLGASIRHARRRRGGRAGGVAPPADPEPRSGARALPPGRRRAERPPERLRAEVTPTRRTAVAFVVLAFAAPFVAPWLILPAAVALASASLVDALLVRRAPVL